MEEFDTKLKKADEDRRRGQEGPAALLQHPDVPYFNSKELDGYKREVEAIYISGLAEVHKQEQVELQKLDAIQKQVHLE